MSLSSVNLILWSPLGGGVEVGELLCARGSTRPATQLAVDDGYFVPGKGFGAGGSARMLAPPASSFPTVVAQGDSFSAQRTGWQLAGAASVTG